MAVIAVGEMVGIAAARDELQGLMRRLETTAADQPGCRRYVFSSALAEPDRFVLVSEWEDQDALERHYRSAAFTDFQHCLHGLLARPSELTLYQAEVLGRPVAGKPMDPRDAD
jgi:quinol monooxygenase YgiN